MQPRRIAKLFVAFAVLALFTAAVAACTSTSEPTATAVKATATSSGPTATAGPPTPTPEVRGEAHSFPTEERFPNPPKVSAWPPKTGGWIRIAVTQPVQLDPNAAGFNSLIMMGVYDRLLLARTSYYDQESYFLPKYYPELAEKWEHPDPLTFVFYLRKGVKWHNVPPVNGREFTADDVVYTLTRSQTGYPAHHVFDMDKAEAVDKYTVKVSLKRPNSLFPYKLASGGLPVLMVAKEAVEEGGKTDGLKDRAIGTGAFLLKEMTRGVSWTLAKNPDYWLKDKDGTALPYVDGVRALIMADHATQVAAWRSKQIDVVEPQNLVEVDNMLKTNSDAFVQRAPPRVAWGTSSGIGFRFDKAPWNDVRVRRAMSMAVDRQGVIDAVHFKDAVWGHPIPWMWGGRLEWPPKPQEWLPKWHFQDVDAAKKLLAEAGYASGIKANIIYAPTTITPREDQLMYTIDNLKRIGIELTPVKLEAAAYNAQYLSGNFDDLVFSWFPYSAGGYEWEDWVYYPFHSKSPKNYTKISDPVLDDLLDKAKAEENEAKRKELQRQLFDRIADQLYNVPVVGVPWYTINHPYVQNWASNSYAWSYYYGADMIRTTWVTEDAPGRKVSY